MPHWLVDVNDKPDDGDTALLWNIHNYQLIQYYNPEDLNHYPHHYENFVSQNLSLL
jgi:hypothetical protein